MFGTKLRLTLFNFHVHEWVVYFCFIATLAYFLLAEFLIVARVTTTLTDNPGAVEQLNFVLSFSFKCQITNYREGQNRVYLFPMFYAQNTERFYVYICPGSLIHPLTFKRQTSCHQAR